MKILKILVITGAFGAYEAASGAAPSTDELVQALVTYGELSAILERERNIGQVEIQRLDKRDVLPRVAHLCGRVLESRTAAVLRVEVKYRKDPDSIGSSIFSSSHYLATPGRSQDLRLCDGR